MTFLARTHGVENGFPSSITRSVQFFKGRRSYPNVSVVILGSVLLKICDDDTCCNLVRPSLAHSFHFCYLATREHEDLHEPRSNHHHLQWNQRYTAKLLSSYHGK